MLLAPLLPFLATNCQMILFHLSISNRAHCERQQQVLIGADATVRVLCAPTSRSTALPVLICAVNVDVASAQPAACDWLRLSLPRSRRFAASFLCVCVCALVFVRGSGCCCVSVCVSCLEFLLLLLLLFPTVTLRGQRKYLGWLACISRSSLDEFTRLWLAWLATHTESKHTESASAFASDSDFEPISATDFEYNSEILIPHPSSAPSAFNLSRAVSLSRLPQCVCPCVCIHLYISVLAN